MDGNDLVTLDRLLILSLIRRLHLAGFIQHSIAKRNILVQPGPLRDHLSQRSMKTPSFRIIDFGRGRNMNERGKNNGNTPKDAENEEQQMKHLLGLEETETWW